jgi:hypothetical protein
MIVILGLIILVAAVVAGVAGVLTNGGSGHALTHGFAVFGYHVTGSTGTLFLYGIVVGAVGLLGLSLLLAGARRTSRRGRAARQGLKQSRRETAAVSQDRDDLVDQRDAARAYTASTLGDGKPPNGRHLTPDNGLLGRLRAFGRAPDPAQPAVTPAEPAAGQPAADVAAGTPAPANDVTKAASHEHRQEGP